MFFLVPATPLDNGWMDVLPSLKSTFHAGCEKHDISSLVEMPTVMFDFFAWQTRTIRQAMLLLRHLPFQMGWTMLFSAKKTILLSDLYLMQYRYAVIINGQHSILTNAIRRMSVKMVEDNQTDHSGIASP